MITSASQTIRASEAAAMLQLAGEALELAHDAVARRTHVIAGLRRLVGARSSLFFEADFSDPEGGFALPGSILWDGEGIDGATLFGQYLITGEPMDPAVPTVIRMPGRYVTTYRQRLVDDDVWYRTEHYETLRRPIGLDHQLYSKVTLPNGSMIGIGLQRETGSRPFTDRDCKLIDLFHEQMARLYQPPAQPPPALPLDHLPPRLRPVLKHLLEGDAEKQVALKLGLSPHTVHQYTKALYRELSVSSRAELLAKFIKPPSIADPPSPRYAGERGRG